MCEIHYWTHDIESGLRKLELNFTHTNIKESFKMEFWNGNTRVCSKCRNELPENTYCFASGGKSFHRYCKLCEGSPSYAWGRNYNNELNCDGFHYCNKCDRILPLNSLYFNKTKGKSNKTGYTSNCKDCINNVVDSFGFQSLNGNVEINDIKEDYKLCHGCRLELPNDDVYFFKKRDRENGSTTCKKCKGFDYGIGRINRVLCDEIGEKERFCSICKNKFHISDMSRSSWCKKCSSHKNKGYYLMPGVRDRMIISNNKRRSLLKGIPSLITKKEIAIIFELFKNQCVYCGMSEDEHRNLFNENLHGDHIHPLSSGGLLMKGNIVPACRSCNCSKNKKDIFSYYDYSEKFTYERLEVILNYIETSLHN